MSELATLVDDSLEMLPTLLSQFSSAADRDTLIQSVDAISPHFQILATGALMLEGSTRYFFSNLAQSGENWRRLLVYLERRGWAPPPATRNMPLLNALAAGQWNLAEQLATHSAQLWQQGEEYEDDFAWAALLNALVLQVPSGSSLLTERLSQLESVGGKTHVDKLELVRALLAKDANDFYRALEAAQAEYEHAIEHLARMRTTPLRSFLPHRHLWMEGLALLRLAGHMGIPPPEVYLRYCPQLALGEANVALQPSWLVPLV